MQEINSTINKKDDITLKELLTTLNKLIIYLKSKYLIIMLASFLGGAIGYIYAFNRNIIYTATTTFVLEEANKSPIGNLGGLASMAGIDINANAGSVFQGENIFELYKSRKMIEKTLFTSVNGDNGSELLINTFIKFNNLNEKWAKTPSIGKVDFEAEYLYTKNRSRVKDSLITSIVNNINKNYLFVTKPDKKLSIIKADIKASNEQFAKKFNESIVKNVNDFYIQTKTKKALDNVKILQHKTDSVRSVMNGEIYKAAEVLDVTPNLNPTRQVHRAAPAQKAQFSAETNKAILTNLVQNLELGKIALLKETPLIQVIDEPRYPLQAQGQGKVKWTIVFAFIFGFSIVTYLLLKKILKELVS